MICGWDKKVNYTCDIDAVVYVCVFLLRFILF